MLWCQGLFVPPSLKRARRKEIMKIKPELVQCVGLIPLICTQIDLFTNTAAILDSIVSDNYYGMLRGQIHTNLPPEHPIITI